MLTRIAVLVSGGGTNLQALIDSAAKSGLGGGEISLVLSSKEGAFALTRAKKAGIPACVVAKADYPDRADYTRAILSKLAQERIDLVVLAGFMFVLSPEFTEVYKNRVINVHPALIPSFCGDGYYGLKVHEAALSYGVKLTGATVHFVSEVTDGGPIILQRSVDILEGDTAESLQKRVMEQAEWVILPEAVRLFCQGRLRVDGRRVIISD